MFVAQVSQHHRATRKEAQKRATVPFTALASALSNRAQSLREEATALKFRNQEQSEDHQD